MNNLNLNPQQARAVIANLVVEFERFVIRDGRYFTLRTSGKRVYGLKRALDALLADLNVIIDQGD